MNQSENQPGPGNRESGPIDPAALIRTEAAALEALAKRLEGPMAEPFSRAVELILRCGQENGRVVVTGMGKSGIIAQKIAATLSSTGSPALFLHPAEAVHGDLGVLMPGDVVVALSASGETEEILRLLTLLKRKGDALISFCCNLNSTLAQASDVALDCGVEREACGLNLAPTASTTAMLALGDALAMAVLQARGFRRQDFAKFHPSGAIGRTVLWRVCDIMRRGPGNAVAGQNLPVREALLVMTQAKSGSLSVVDQRGKLIGVFTDGDFRRRMAADRDLLSQPLKCVMTRHPVCIPQDALVVEALKIFNQRNIDDLIVVNARHEPVGLIDSQDLPKLKIM